MGNEGGVGNTTLMHLNENITVTLQELSCISLIIKSSVFSLSVVSF